MATTQELYIQSLLAQAAYANLTIGSIVSLMKCSESKAFVNYCRGQRLGFEYLN